MCRFNEGKMPREEGDCRKAILMLGYVETPSRKHYFRTPENSKNKEHAKSPRIVFAGDLLVNLCQYIIKSIFLLPLGIM